MKLFKQEDFEKDVRLLHQGHGDIPYISTPLASNIANKKLKEWLDNSRTLYASKDTEWQWTEYQDDSDTHTAKLVCIEEIKKECKEHEPVPYRFSFIVNNVAEVKNWKDSFKCKHCGVHLVAEWKVK